MSVKLYDGSRLEITSLQALYAFALRANDELGALQACLWRKDLARDATNLLDAAALGRLRDPAAQGRAAGAVAYDRARAASKLDRADSLDYTLSFFPRPRQVLALVFSGDYRIRDAWHAMPGVLPWGYGTGTDKPEELTTRQWARRKSEWTKALRMDEPGGGVPAKTGLEMHGPTWREYVQASELAAAQPSFDKRVRELARDDAFDAWLDGRKVHSGNAYSMLSAFDAHVRADPTLLESATLAVASKLKPRLTDDDFKAPLPQEPPT